MPLSYIHDKEVDITILLHIHTYISYIIIIQILLHAIQDTRCCLRLFSFSTYIRHEDTLLRFRFHWGSSTATLPLLILLSFRHGRHCHCCYIFRYADWAPHAIDIFTLLLPHCQMAAAGMLRRCAGARSAAAAAQAGSLAGMQRSAGAQAPVRARRAVRSIAGARSVARQQCGAGAGAGAVLLSVHYCCYWCCYTYLLDIIILIYIIHIEHIFTHTITPHYCHYYTYMRFHAIFRLHYFRRHHATIVPMKPRRHLYYDMLVAMFVIIEPMPLPSASFHTPPDTPLLDIFRYYAIDVYCFCLLLILYIVDMPILLPWYYRLYCFLRHIDIIITLYIVAIAHIHLCFIYYAKKLSWLLWYCHAETYCSYYWSYYCFMLLHVICCYDPSPHIFRCFIDTLILYWLIYCSLHAWYCHGLHAFATYI